MHPGTNRYLKPSADTNADTGTDTDPCAANTYPHSAGCKFMVRPA